MPCTRGVHDYVCVRLRLCTTPCVRLDLQGVMCTMCHLSVCLAGCLSVRAELLGSSFTHSNAQSGRSVRSLITFSFSCLRPFSFCPCRPSPSLVS